MMKIYLDSSALNRIFDDQAQVRIYLEASAMLIVFELIEQKQLDLVSSEVVDYELDHNPYQERKLFVTTILTRSKQYQKIDSTIVSRAKQLEQQGIKALDALHIACAEALKSNVFITCDDKLLKSTAPQISVLTPPQFVVNLTQGVIKNGNA